MSKAPAVSSTDTAEARSKDVESGGAEDAARRTTVSEKVINVREYKGVFRTMRRWEIWLDRKMGVELQGIDRIAEEDKRPPSIWNVFFLWWSLNVHVGVIALGLLGPQFGLSLKASIVAALIGNLLGCSTTAFTGTLGPKLGLRMIACSRYSFGFWGAKIASVLNVVIGGGYAVVNFVVVGEILSAVSDYTMSITVGIIIIAILSYIPCIFGFKVIHTFEKYSWIVTFILMCVLVGQAAPHVDTNAPNAVGGLGYAGAYLSILAINFSNSSGWCSIAADYYCNYPAKTNPWIIFSLTYFGILIPLTFSTTIGACLANAAAAYAPWGNAYAHHGLGGLIRNVFHPLGWSKFCLVVFTFSVLGNNIAVSYSSGLSIQLLGHYFHAVPRMLWSLLVVVVVAVLALAGQQSLSTIIANFVSLLGYWTVSFTLILLVEDKWFRRREGYDLDAWDSPGRLPWGAAAVLALLCGYLGGGLPGMAQSWYVGPVALQFGPYGGDVGVYMSGAITLLVYPVARALERRWTGR